MFTKPSWANLSRVDSILGNYSMAFLFGAFFAVDTFFFMSGPGQPGRPCPRVVGRWSTGFSELTGWVRHISNRRSI